MKTLFALIFFSLSVCTFAGTEKLVEACRDIGTQKLMRQAQAWGTYVDSRDVRECGVDSRPLNPTKYVWFCATATNGKKITVMTQKPLFKDCF